MIVDRRTLMSAAGGLLAAAAFPVRAAEAGRTRVVLLGTKGGPTPAPNRAAPATLIVVGGRPIVVDCGNGVATQLVKAGVRLPDLSRIFITHDHSDHVADVATLLVLAWASGLKTKVDVFGPPPIDAIVRDGLAAARFDIAARMREEGRPALAPLVKVHPIAAGGVVLRAPEVTVTCALVDHLTVRPAFAYRFDTADRSIVISGDTTRSEALIALARDADLLIHEALYAPFVDRIVEANAPTLRDHLLRSHTTTEQLGIIAAEARVKKLVLTHLVPGGVGPDGRPLVSDEMWLEGVRKAYSGPAVVGRDLMEV